MANCYKRPPDLHVGRGLILLWEFCCIRWIGHSGPHRSKRRVWRDGDAVSEPRPNQEPRTFQEIISQVEYKGRGQRPEMLK
jgi:hypothetical protein